MTVTVEDGFFDRLGPAWADGGGWHASPAFLVVTHEPDAAAAALAAAGKRIMHVDERGVEVEPWQLAAGAAETPSWVSEAYLTDRGPAMCVDTNGELPRAQAEAILRILREELERRDVAAHVVVADADVFDGRFPTLARPRTARLERETAAVRRAWFVVRGVTCVTTTGYAYEDFEYRACDGSWVRRRTDAERFPEPPTALVEDLRREPRPAERGEPSGILLPDDDSDWWPLPPIGIRQRPD